MNINKVIVAGRATEQPALKNTPSGAAVTSFTIATNRSYKDQQGQKVEETEFVKVVLWGKVAEIAAQYLQKGQEALVIGRLKTRSWQDQSGQKKYVTEVIGEDFQLGQKPQNSAQGAAVAQKTNTSPIQENQTQPQQAGAQKRITQDDPFMADTQEVSVDDIPF